MSRESALSRQPEHSTMDSMGFIGAAESLGSAQQAALSDLLRVHAPRYFHHGDCLGSDVDAHALAMRGACRVVAHPPTDEIQRAHLKAHPKRCRSALPTMPESNAVEAQGRSILEYSCFGCS